MLTRQSALPHLRAVLAVPTTRTVRGIPTEVPLDEDDGMPSPCALTLDNLTLVPKALFTERLTQLDVVRMACEALLVAAGC